MSKHFTLPLFQFLMCLFEKKFEKLKAASLNSLAAMILGDLIYANQMTFHNTLIWNKIK